MLRLSRGGRTVTVTVDETIDEVSALAAAATAVADDDVDVVVVVGVADDGVVVDGDVGVGGVAAVDAVVDDDEDDDDVVVNVDDIDDTCRCVFM